MWLNVAIGALLCVRPQRDYSTSVIRVPLQKRVAAPVRAATRMAESELPAEDWEASSMTVKYLQERCRERGLATYGTKAKIIDRLRSCHERGKLFSGEEAEIGRDEAETATTSYVHRKWKIASEVEMETTELSMTTDRRGTPGATWPTGTDMKNTSDVRKRPTSLEQVPNWSRPRLEGASTNMIRAEDLDAGDERLQWKIPFGKHCGDSMFEVAVSDPGYLAWLASSNTAMAHPECSAALATLGIGTVPNASEDDLAMEMPSGLHKGVPLRDVPSAYLIWLCSNPSKRVERGSKNTTHRPSQ